MNGYKDEMGNAFRERKSNMVENKKLKRDLVLQSFAPLFLILCVKHAHCYWRFLPSFFVKIRVHDWSVFHDIVKHAFWGDFVVFTISLIWVIWATLIYGGFIGILRVNFDSYGESLVVETDKRDTGAAFLVSFVLPLLIDDVSTLRGFIVFVLLLLMMIRLLINSNLFYQNPLLTILGYRTFEFQFVHPYKDIKDKGKVYIGVTKSNEILRETTIKRKYIADDVFIIFND